MTSSRILNFICIFIIGITCLVFPADVPAFVFDKIIAIINDDVITSSDINRLIKPLYEQYKNIYSGEELNKKLLSAQKEALDIMIDNKLLYQEAVKYKVEIDKEEIDRKINEVKARFGSEDEFIQALESDGITVEKYRQEIKEQMMIMRLVGYFVTSRVVVAPIDVEKYYNEHKEDFFVKEMVKFDLITVKDSEENPALDKANKIFSLLESDAALSEIKGNFKDDDFVSVKEDMGFYGRDQLLKEIEENAFSLQIGEFSRPFVIENEFYVVILTDRITEGTASLSDVFQSIENKLTYDKVRDKKAEFIKELREKAYICYK
ncbi:SurA N-terminal domain-containing protein [bacterium]|jgi:peptidyl-prolyl cis-trans isomerase SurA|nr:SurA N-terminal domain-containing protein [bacterium]